MSNNRPKEISPALSGARDNFIKQFIAGGIQRGKKQGFGDRQMLSRLGPIVDINTAPFLFLENHSIPLYKEGVLPYLYLSKKHGLDKIDHRKRNAALSASVSSNAYVAEHPTQQGGLLRPIRGKISPYLKPRFPKITNLR